jgi:uncharacterized protein
VRTVAVIDVAADGSVLVRETLPEDVQAYRQLPMALTPAAPPNTRPLAEAVREWGTDLLAARQNGRWPTNATVDLLRRTPPRTRSGSLAPEGPADGSGRIAAVTASLLDLDASYLAVQGPPGTGKSYLGAYVIAQLVAEHGWRVGVVAQSHAVVENLLDRVVDTGLDADLVGKVPSGAAEAPRFTALRRNGHLEFAAERDGRGYVVGGTAWDFANAARIPRGSLDLLVIDEAGQFSLASTVAVGVAARNLLLLGDPQQLPQVSQGRHPEPVDGSALGWVSDGHDVLPAELGYFLAESRRMHPALAEAVSRLSYEGRLHAHPGARDRELGGVEPGLHPVPHLGNATASPQEAAVVVRIVDDLIGRSWSDPDAGISDAPLAQEDVIVVTPYNAQLAEVRELLDAAGFPQVRVGTVDKFQGQEAAVAIVSLAASSAADVPRGMSFLLMKNRLNVAISRAKWAAYLVHSPELTEFLPTTPAGVGELSAFIRLVEPGPVDRATVAAGEAAGEARA